MNESFYRRGKRLFAQSFWVTPDSTLGECHLPLPRDIFSVRNVLRRFLTEDCPKVGNAHPTVTNAWPFELLRFDEKFLGNLGVLTDNLAKLFAVDSFAL